MEVCETCFYVMGEKEREEKDKNGNNSENTRE